MSRNVLNDLKESTLAAIHPVIEKALKTTEPVDDPYFIESYYGRKKIVYPKDEDFVDGIDIWIHPTILADEPQNRYYLHYPILENVVEHRSELLFTAVISELDSHEALINEFTTIKANFENRILSLAQHFWALSEPKRREILAEETPEKTRRRLIKEDKKDFHKKSEAFRFCLDRLHEDMVLLIAKKMNEPNSLMTRSVLKRAAKLCKIKELTSYSHLSKRDILRIECNSKHEGSWEFFDRHLPIADRNNSFTRNSHHPEYAGITNYARTHYGILAQDNIKLSFEATRYASPVRLESYAGKKKSLHLIRLDVYNTLQEVLTHDLHLIHNQNQMVEHIHHLHTHLITASGLGSIKDHQREMFADNTVASFALRNSELQHKSTGTYSYCSFGINEWRRGKSRHLGVTNEVALMDIFLKVHDRFPHKFMLDQQRRDFYESTLKTAQAHAQNYIQLVIKQKDFLQEDTKNGKKITEQELDKSYERFVDAQKEIYPYSHQILKDLALQCQAPAFQDILDALYKMNIQQYYVMASLRFILTTTQSNYGKDSWTHIHLNGMLQALIQIVCGNIEIVSSYGCKSANDRSLLISMELYELGQLMSKKEKMTSKRLEEIFNLNHCHHSQNIAIHQTIKDSGAPPKFRTDNTYATRGVKKLLPFARFASHTADKTVRKIIRKKPLDYLTHYNFDSREALNLTIELSKIKNPKQRINAFLTAPSTNNNFSGQVDEILDLYPKTCSLKHSRQLFVANLQDNLFLDFAKEKDRYQFLRNIWYHFDAIQDEKSLLHHLLEAILIKTLCTYFNVSMKMDVPKLLATTKSEFRELLQSCGLIMPVDSEQTTKIKEQFRCADKLVTSFSYKRHKSSKEMESLIKQINNNIQDQPAERNQFFLSR